MHIHYTHYIYYNNNLTEWKLVKASKFEVHSYYEALMGRGKFPTDVAFFAWTAALDRILIVNNLWKRDMHFQTI